MHLVNFQNLIVFVIIIKNYFILNYHITYLLLHIFGLYPFYMFPYKTIIEIVSAILILIAFELINRKNIKGYSFMALGQFLAMVICIMTSLWFLAIMHFINFLLMLRGYYKWKS